MVLLKYLPHRSSNNLIIYTNTGLLYMYLDKLLISIFLQEDKRLLRSEPFSSSLLRPPSQAPGTFPLVHLEHRAMPGLLGHTDVYKEGFYLTTRPSKHLGNGLTRIDLK